MTSEVRETITYVHAPEADAAAPPPDNERYAIAFKSGAVVTVENVSLAVITYSPPPGYSGPVKSNEWLLMRGNRPVNLCSLSGYGAAPNADIAQGFTAAIDGLIKLA